MRMCESTVYRCRLLLLNAELRVCCRYNDVGADQSMKQEVKEGHRR